MWHIKSGVYTDTADSAEKTAGLSNGIRVLPAVQIVADKDRTSGQTLIWSTGVTMADARVVGAMLLDTLIPLIRVDNALRSFPEQKNFVTLETRTRGGVSAGPKKENNAGARGTKRSRTTSSADGQGTGGRLVPVPTTA